MKLCPTCVGKGVIIKFSIENPFHKSEMVQCPTCNGKGKIPEREEEIKWLG
jgi:DnaJ-class molecular chaperone